MILIEIGLCIVGVFMQKETDIISANKIKAIEKCFVYCILSLTNAIIVIKNIVKTTIAKIINFSFSINIIVIKRIRN